MSDRIAVFSRGRIEQIGSPADLYERPASAFVAGFVGVSNLISGATAQAITGSPDTFSIRPEKIRILAPGAPAPGGACTAAGTLRDVIYLGMYTRYLVSLEGSVDLVVIEQNRDTSTILPQSARGGPVRLTWDPAHNRRLAAEG